MSVAGVTLTGMAVTAGQVEKVRAQNLRVPREDFAAVWAAAERRDRRQGERGVLDWYAAGVYLTCLWMAGGIVRPARGRPYPARSPVTGRGETAYEELIEAESLAAELLPQRQPQLLQRRPGWCEGIRATLRWAWRGQGPPPLDADGEPTVWPAPRRPVD